MVLTRSCAKKLENNDFEVLETNKRRKYHKDKNDVKKVKTGNDELKLSSFLLLLLSNLTYFTS